MKAKIMEVAISEFSKKGEGIGYFKRSDGATCPVEVPFTMPGDAVQADVKKKRGGVYDSKLHAIVSPSLERIAPRCIHFGYCGGCRSQHIPYEKQLRIKEDFVFGCLEPLSTEKAIFHPIAKSDPPWEYRNKMEFSFSSDKHGAKYLGLIMASSRGKVFNLTECHLTSPWFSVAVDAMRKWWLQSGLDAYHPNRNAGSLRTLILREGQRTGDRLAMLTVSGNPDYALHKSHLKTFVETLQKAIEPEKGKGRLSIFLRIQQIKKGMPTNFFEWHLYGPDSIAEVLEIKTVKDSEPQKLFFNVSPSAFFQPNTRQAENLYSLSLQMLEGLEGANVYDLYCGTGTLGIAVSLHAKNVVGIEISPESILDAKTNAALNKRDNIAFYAGAVHEVLEKEKELIKPDIVMVDPPRSGLDQTVVKQLIALSAPQILYVSCNPSTQAENIRELREKGGYRIKAVQPVDQFPHTHHVENCVILQKG